MQLIDQLEDRYDRVKLMERITDASVRYEDGDWYITIDGGEYGINAEAMNSLLSILKVPIKYAWRFAESSALGAETMVNFWLEESGEIGYLIEGLVVTQVFAGGGMYIPGVKINDLIFDYLKGEVSVHSFYAEADVFSAIYLSDKCIDIAGGSWQVGIRVLYSDCFSITPRFDGVLCSEDTGATLAWPTMKRKFRVASNTYPQVFSQVEEFIDVSIDGMMSELVRSLRENWEGMTEQVVVADTLIFRLCTELRLSRKIGDEILEFSGVSTLPPLTDFAKSVTRYLMNLKPDSCISVEVARDIQVAVSKFLVGKSFK